MLVTILHLNTEVPNVLYIINNSFLLIIIMLFSVIGDVNAPASTQTSKTFLPWETHLFTRLLKYGMYYTVYICMYRLESVTVYQLLNSQTLAYKPIYTMKKLRPDLWKKWYGWHNFSQ